MVDAQLAAEATASTRQVADRCSIIVQNVHFAANEQILAAHFGWVFECGDGDGDRAWCVLGVL